jgi:hypothetical protein
MVYEQSKRQIYLVFRVIVTAQAAALRQGAAALHGAVNAIGKTVVKAGARQYEYMHANTSCGCCVLYGAPG